MAAQCACPSRARIEQLGIAACAKIYSEKVSGARSDRPELQRLLKALEPGALWWSPGWIGWRGPPSTCSPSSNRLLTGELFLNPWPIHGVAARLLLEGCCSRFWTDSQNLKENSSRRELWRGATGRNVPESRWGENHCSRRIRLQKFEIEKKRENQPVS
jgi:hypothetical protein